MQFPLLIVPAGGDGTRMGGAEKWKLEIRGKRVIDWILDYWAPYCGKAVVVVKEGNPKEHNRTFGGMAVDYLPVNTPTVNAAILEGLRFHGAPERFLVVLGDCLVDGVFEWTFLHPPEYHLSGAAIIEGDTDFNRSYAVDDRGGLITGVIEKPTCGMGVYTFTWFDLPALISDRGITGALRYLTKEGKLRPIPYSGRYLNITYSEDLQRW